MAQGKMKVKATLPGKAKKQSVHRGASNVKKSKVGMKKKMPQKMDLSTQMQIAVTKEINKSIEDQARGSAVKLGDSIRMDKKNKKETGSKKK